MNTPFSKFVTPNWEEFVKCIARQGTPQRVHSIELFLDNEIKNDLCKRYDLTEGLKADNPFYEYQREIRTQRFLGYDYVVCNVEGGDLPVRHLIAEDTAEIKRTQGREFIEEHRGPITSWDEFETYPWPNLERFTTKQLEWYQKNLPEDMCIIGGLVSHFLENITFLMGYETLCYSLHDQRDLVQAIADRILEIERHMVSRLLEFDRVRIIWGSDDMGFRTGTLISPKDMRSLVLPGHKAMAHLAHDAGRLYILHSCGNLSAIMNDLIEDVKIDGKHSYEDTILDVREAKKLWGDRLALLGGLDLDFICRAREDEIRSRVHSTLEICQQGGGYCLGTGNSVANYVPVDHYLAMLEEGRRFA